MPASPSMDWDSLSSPSDRQSSYLAVDPEAGQSSYLAVEPEAGQSKYIALGLDNKDSYNGIESASQTIEDNVNTSQKPIDTDNKAIEFENIAYNKPIEYNSQPTYISIEPDSQPTYIAVAPHFHINTHIQHISSANFTQEQAKSDLNEQINTIIDNKINDNEIIRSENMDELLVDNFDYYKSHKLEYESNIKLLNSTSATATANASSKCDNSPLFNLIILFTVIISNQTLNF